MVQISEEEFKKILYHLDQILGLYSYGREYQKIVELIKKLPLEKIDLSDFYHIRFALKGK